MAEWKTLRKQQVLQQGKFLTVEFHTIELSDGHVIEDWPWVITPDFVNVVVMDKAGQFVLFRQGKYGYEGLSLAPIGGYIEVDEDPLTAAKRETLEELGYEAEEWISLGAYRVDANRGAGMAHLFLALGARKVADPIADDLEAQEVVFLSQAELEAAPFNGDFKVLPWASLVALSLLHLGRRQ
jgi:ADP-ribose pyrophosphatase